ncbi:Monocyte to macrophage differentiation factor [Hondaea fermentalgiana]|uniref:Monocyte to macrophage differentiation factor n=1 Tax=Hondaea fermentalgiana TaxID=2315210 RepID=A0A2R5GE97_9STRA|nr:Monocyte to macrophage differentiation factor [Hondaea fermentalgiana]|eukprot:GBG28058.1 Monocyte to macrophage differentiation factor [Hondaea fermentalgiana]
MRTRAAAAAASKHQKEGEEEESKGLEAQSPGTKTTMSETSPPSAHPYVTMCRECGCKVDPSVLTSLATDWSFVKASNEYSLLPLLLLVREEKAAKGKAVSKLREHLKTLRIRHADAPTHITDANARVVGLLLRECSNLRHLDVSRMKMSKYGAREIVAGLDECPTLETLNLSFNPGIAPALREGKLEKVIGKLENLTLLDVTNDQLGFAQVDALHTAMKETHAKSGLEFEIRDGGNNVFEEVLNALTHGVGVFLALVGTVVMMYHASAEGQSRRTFYACGVYCLCLILLFVSSTLLHAAFLNEKVSTVLGLLDHTAIYFLIAGTYLPFCVVSLEKHPYGWAMAVGEWGLAFAGIVLCIVHERVQVPMKMPIELALYLGMGWMLGIAWEDVKTHISPGAVELLLYGGLAYTGGVVFFVMEKLKHPIGHAVWHIFVLIGATCHYFAVLFFVVGLEEEGLRAAPRGPVGGTLSPL